MNLCRRLGIIAALSLVLLLFSACPQPQKASEEIDAGTFEGQLYRNAFFGFELLIPESWEIQDMEIQREMLQVGSEFLAGDDPHKKEQYLKLVDLQVVPLMAVFRHPLGTTPNPSLISIAEKVSGVLPPIKHGRDYLQHSMEAMQEGTVQVAFPRDVYSETIDGVDFDVLDVQMQIEGMTVLQKQFVRIDKGYALCFILSYLTEEELVELRTALGAVSFKG